MDKRLRTTILIASLVLVGFIVALLIFSMVSNLASVEIYDFRVYEMPTVTASASSSSTPVYEIYLSGQNSLNYYDISASYPISETTDYVFVSSDENVAVIEKYQTPSGFIYRIEGKAIGQAKFSVTKVVTGDEETESMPTFYSTFSCIVYRELSSCDMFLTTPSNNVKEVKVVASASNSGFTIDFVSSNASVATVVSANGRYYIKALTAGKTVITAYCTGNTNIRDSFTVNVFDNQPNDLVFIDADGNKITSGVMFDDGRYYNFHYKLAASNANGEVNASNVRVSDVSLEAMNITAWESDNASLSLTPFDEGVDSDGAGVILDEDNYLVKIKKSNVDFSNDGLEIPHALGYVTLQTYIIGSDGEIVVTGTYTLNVNVYHRVAVAKELEISTSPSFSTTDKFIYNYSGINWENVNITELNRIYYSGLVRSFYIKCWMVFNNGDRELIISDIASTTSLGIDLSQSPDSSYIIIFIRDEAIGNNISPEITTGASLTITFLGGTSLYALDNAIYSFNYWDTRLRSNNEITDANGNVVGFIS